MTQKCQPVHAMPVILVASLGYDDLGWAMKKSLSLLVYWLWVRFIPPALRKGINIHDLARELGGPVMSRETH